MLASSNKEMQMNGNKQLIDLTSSGDNAEKIWAHQFFEQKTDIQRLVKWQLKVWGAQ